MRAREFGGRPSAAVVACLDMVAKGVRMLMVVVVTDPEWGNLEGKASTQRAAIFPMVAIAVPALYWLGIVGRNAHPWLADLLLTLVGFTESSATGWTCSTRWCDSTTGCTS